MTTTMTTPATTPAQGASGTVLTQAFAQWATRPEDQRFGSLEDLHAATLRHRTNAVEARTVDLRTLTVQVGPRPADGLQQPQPILMSEETGQSATFSHNGFGQLCRRVGAPAHYLRTLPTPLVTGALRHGLRHASRGAEKNTGDTLLFSSDGTVGDNGLIPSLQLRSATSDGYTRVWNCEVVARLQTLVAEYPEWQPAPAAFDGSRGLYASDYDMFAFLVDNDRRIFERGPGGGLARGFFVQNSETGNGSFVLTTFWYEYVCGNHRVWGASGVQEIRIPHIGNADARVFEQLRGELRKYADASAQEDERNVRAAQSHVLGKTKDEVVAHVFGLNLRDVTKRALVQSYDLAEQRVDWYGAPNTVWGLTGAMTEIARDNPIASERVALERAAGRVLQIAF